MIWNIWSYEPAVILLRLSWEESQGDVPVIVSGKGFLARTANLPTRSGKRRGKLDPIENRDIVQRVAELEAGAGIGHTNLWLHRCHCQCRAPASAPAWISDMHRFKEPGGDSCPLDGACVAAMPADDGRGRKTRWALLWKPNSGVVSGLFDSQSKFSWTARRPRIK